MTTHAAPLNFAPIEVRSRFKLETLQWVPTVIFSAIMTFSGVMFLAGRPQVFDMLHRLGYPEYFRFLLGLAKLFGAAALLTPRPWPVREWAYAGFAFLLIAAVASHAWTGDSVGHTAPAVIALIPLTASYVLRRMVLGARRAS